MLIVIEHFDGKFNISWQIHVEGEGWMVPCLGSEGEGEMVYSAPVARISVVG